MSRFNRKGYRTLLGRKNDGTLAPFPVKIGSPLDKQNSAAIRKAKKERLQAFREYKKNLREAKKKVPLAERAKINWSEMPERYL